MLALAACPSSKPNPSGTLDTATQPQTTDVPPPAEDVSVDGEGAADSFGSQLCVAGEAVYVLFVDGRDRADEDQVDLWLNVSTDLGATWLEAPVKVNRSAPAGLWNADLHCDDSGVAVVWEDDRDGTLGNHQIYFNRSIDGGATFLDQDVLVEDDPAGDAMSLGPKLVGVGDDLFVVWYDNTFGGYDILLARSADGGVTWGEPVRLDSDPAGSAYSARPELTLGVGPDGSWTGEVLVVWEDSRDGRADLYVARSEDGGLSFAPDQRVDLGDPPGENDSFEPRIRAAAADVYVVWHQRREGEGADIFANYSADGGATWLGEALRLDTDEPGVGNSLFPQCVLVDGTLHVAWSDQRGAVGSAGELGTDVYHRTVVAGVPGAETRLDVGTEAGHSNSTNVRIAADGGAVMVAWQDHRGEVELGTENGYEELYYNFAPIGGGFDTTTDFRIDAQPEGRSQKADLDVAVVGADWLASWTDVQNGTSGVLFQRLPLAEGAAP
jgi:hypothetical protein